MQIRTFSRSKRAIISLLLFNLFKSDISFLYQNKMFLTQTINVYSRKENPDIFTL